VNIISSPSPFFGAERVVRENSQWLAEGLSEWIFPFEEDGRWNEILNREEKGKQDLDLLIQTNGRRASSSSVRI
jgi:hypothetical protein